MREKLVKMESLRASFSPTQFATVLFAWKEQFDNFEYQRRDKAQFHVKEYQDAAKCISEGILAARSRRTLKSTK